MSAAFLLAAALVTGSVEVPESWSNADVAQRAEDAFREGVARRGTVEAARPYFRQAASYFEELRRRGASNATLFCNLGNAQLLSGDLPGAILSFRRGLQLAPTDRALRANLAEARDRVVYPAFGALGRQPVEQRPAWLPRLRVDWLFYAALTCFALSWVVATRWLMVRRNGQLLGAGALVVTAVVLAAFAASGLNARAPTTLVVIADDGILLRKGNSLAFPPRYDVPLNRGVEGTLLFRRDDWLQIELASGEVGWVPRRAALVDEQAQ